MSPTRCASEVGRLPVAVAVLVATLAGAAAVSPPAAAAPAGTPVPAGSTLVLTGTVLDGETATGSVVGPQGTTLAGVVVEVDGEKTRTDAAGRFPVHVPAGAVGRAIAVALPGAAGAGASVRLPVVAAPHPAAAAAPPRIVDAPAYPAAGERMTLQGSGFRGDPAGSVVRLGAAEAPVLAATSAEIVATVPSTQPTGPQPLTVSTAAGSSAPVPVQVVRLSLGSTDTELMRGQSGAADLRIEGTADPVDVEVVNHSGDVLRLEGGDRQRVRTGGGPDNRATLHYRGIGPGAWTLSATVLGRTGPVAADVAPGSTAPGTRPGVLRLVKRVEGDAAVAADFHLRVRDRTGADAAVLGGSEDGASAALPPGIYVVEESGDTAGWVQLFSGDCDGAGGVEVTAGRRAECVVTNVRVGSGESPPPGSHPGLIEVVKRVEGGPRDAGDFELRVVDPASGTPLAVRGSAAGTAVPVRPGTYTVEEDADAGYVRVFSGDCDGSGRVRVAPGQRSVCVVTNVHRGGLESADGGAPEPVPGGTGATAAAPGILRVVKRVEGGPRRPDDFGLRVRDRTGASVAGGAGAAGGRSAALSGGLYVVEEEEAHPGYVTTFSGACDHRGAVRVVAGRRVDCVVTNVWVGAEDVAAEPGRRGALRVVKTFAGRGAEAETRWVEPPPASVPFDVEDSGGRTVARLEAGPDGAAVALAPGSYRLWERTSRHDELPVFSGDCEGSGWVRIRPGEETLCRVTDVRVDGMEDAADRYGIEAPGLLRVVKTVEGGPARAADAELEILGRDGSTVLSFAGDEEGGIFALTAGFHQVSERDPPPGYVPLVSGDCDPAGGLFVRSGSLHECTVRNVFVGSDQIDPGAPGRGVLRVVKRVDGGPARPADARLAVTPVRTERGLSVAGAADGTPVALPAGEVRVSEEGAAPGYVVTYAGACDAGGTVRVERGREAVCVVTNTWVGAGAAGNSPTPE